MPISEVSNPHPNVGVWVWAPPDAAPELRRAAHAEQVFRCALVAADRGWRIGKILSDGEDQARGDTPNLLELCNLIRIGELDGLLISSAEILPTDPHLAREVREATKDAILEFASTGQEERSER
jgi:hypothetical protein